ncbi:SRPBCC domain-containing protein [Hydrogenophaga sp. RWCD_12]|uniref:SRPBCC domain-containing protein n=1 Tax=Hydrogenophaga sp. RWCD_12 TaxID=3391190 RepID=UPI0039856735
MTTTDMLTVQTTLQCGLARAWNAYTAPKAIVQWNFAAPEWHCPRAENDLRVGGTLKSRMEARDGSMGFDFEGTYTEVVPMERLVYAMGDERQVVATFKEAGGLTELTVRFTPDSTFPAEYQVGGWQAILNNYKAYAESAA